MQLCSDLSAGVRMVLLTACALAAFPVARAFAAPVQGGISVQTPAAVVAGDPVLVSGAAAAAAASGGGSIRVRLVRDGQTLVRRVAPVGSDGGFQIELRSPSRGSLSVRATMLDAAQVVTGTGAAVTSVLPRRVSGRSSPQAVRALQSALRRKGFVPGGTSAFDARTARAVLAFRKLERMQRSSQADVAMMRRLAVGRGGFQVRFPGHGRHLEADLSRQILALIGADGRVEGIYPTSTGAPATPTIRGSFRVYRKQAGTNAKGMVDSSYFIRGYAVHGFASVPTFAASHGCLRVPVPDAATISRWLRVGTRIDTYV